MTELSQCQFLLCQQKKTDVLCVTLFENIIVSIGNAFYYTFDFIQKRESEIAESFLCLFVCLFFCFFLFLCKSTVSQCVRNSINVLDRKLLFPSSSSLSCSLNSNRTMTRVIISFSYLLILQLYMRTKRLNTKGFNLQRFLDKHLLSLINLGIL